MNLLLEHYESAQAPEGVLTLSPEQATRLAWGLIQDFVPAFRRPKNPGAPSKYPEWKDQYDTDPPDLRLLAVISRLLKKHEGKRKTLEGLFEYIAANCREELPSLFRGRTTGKSLKTAYFEILANFNGAPEIKDMVHHDPDGEVLREDVKKLAEALRKRCT
ncbi:MAG: hypothetical protein WCP68_16305 [Enhydrobacter sp.]